jgi:predicted DNA-binding transcriptional regulator AlpA
MPAEPILPIHPAPDSTPAGPVEALLLTADQAAALCGVSAATWYRMASAGRCPAPVRLSRGCVRWRAEELRDWIKGGCPPRGEWEARRAAGNGRGWK